MTSRPVSPPGPVYALADWATLASQSQTVPDAVAALAEAGIRWIQIRAKGAVTDADLYRMTEESLERLERGGHRTGAGAVRLWVDDRADVAALLPVAGVHVGQHDLSPEAARAVVGESTWIGASTHDPGQLAAAAADPAVDVVAVGPVYPTTGKADPDPVVGLDLVRRAREATDKTLVAIGGIDARRLPEVLAAGADTVAVLGAVCRGDVAANARRLLKAAA